MRALLALWFAAITGWLFISGAPVPDALIAITTAVNTFYFASVGEETRNRIHRGEEGLLPEPLLEGAP